MTATAKTPAANSSATSTSSASSPMQRRLQTAVRGTMRELMRTHGLPRADAAKAVLETIVADADGVAEPPEREVLAVMRAHGIGYDEARAALMVAAALDGQPSLPRALARLTRRVSAPRVLETLRKRRKDASGGAPRASLPLPPHDFDPKTPVLRRSESLQSFTSCSTTTDRESLHPASRLPAIDERRGQEDRPSSPLAKDVDAATQRHADAAPTRARSDSAETEVSQKLESSSSSSASKPPAAPTRARTRTKRARSEDAAAAASRTDAAAAVVGASATAGVGSHKRTRPSRG